MPDYGMGYIPDKYDYRDYTLRLKAEVFEPQTISYRSRLGPIRNQGGEGTCVGFSGAGTKEYFDNTQRGTSEIFSPRFLYEECKKRDGIPHIEGTYPRTAMQVLHELGVVFERDWPYVEFQRDYPPTETVFADRAKTQKIVAYARLLNTTDMIASLMKNGPFLLGVIVTEGWFTPQAEATGVIDATNTRQLGGHAIVCIGYNKETDMFEIRNSWGTSYGDNGHNWLPRTWVEKYGMDAWALVDNTNIDEDLVIIKPEPEPEPIKPQTKKKSKWQAFLDYLNSLFG